jgi:hypothetical protein
MGQLVSQIFYENLVKIGQWLLAAFQKSSHKSEELVKGGGGIAPAV